MDLKCCVVRLGPCLVYSFVKGFFTNLASLFESYFQQKNKRSLMLLY